MTVDLIKPDLFLILEALESYRLDIDHGNHNGHEYDYSLQTVQNLIDYISKLVNEKE
jgi:hypothetical protein